MTPTRAAGVLRRRVAYLERVIEGKHLANQPHRHEVEEREALVTVLRAVADLRRCP